MASFKHRLKAAERSERIRACAPEILEALKNVISFFDYTEIDPDDPKGVAYQIARAVIAKAEGRDDEKYMPISDGLMILALGLAYIYGGLTGWASETSRGATAPGYYEHKQLRATDGPPAGYDHWTKQLERRKERGR
jgi:hypothetical protein